MLGETIFVICFIIAVVVFFIIDARSNLDDPKLVEIIPLGLLIGSLLSVVLMLFGAMFSLLTEPVKEVSESYDIISINDNSGMEGSFFLGSGTIDTDLYYFYYKRTDKGLKRVKIPASSTYIQEGYKNPTITVIEKVGTDTGIWSVLAGSGAVRYRERIIKVPEGTVIRELKLDNK